MRLIKIHCIYGYNVYRPKKKQIIYFLTRKSAFQGLELTTILTISPPHGRGRRFRGRMMTASLSSREADRHHIIESNALMGTGLGGCKPRVQSRDMLICLDFFSCNLPRITG